MIQTTPMIQIALTQSKKIRTTTPIQAAPTTMLITTLLITLQNPKTTPKATASELKTTRQITTQTLLQTQNKINSYF